MQKILGSQQSHLAHKSLLSVFSCEKVLNASRFEGFLWWPGWLKPLFATFSTFAGGQIV